MKQTVFMQGVFKVKCYHNPYNSNKITNDSRVVMYLTFKPPTTVVITKHRNLACLLFVAPQDQGVLDVVGKNIT